MRLSPFILLAVAACPATGAETAWQDIVPEVRARLVADTARGAPGTVYAALQIEMPEDYTTYWRIPGQSGIAPELDWTGSRGISGAAVAFPLPEADLSNGYLDYVYRGSTVLPIEVKTSADGAVLEASLFLGICSDVCMPVSVDFSLPLDGDAPRAVADIVGSAFSRVPDAWEFPDPALSSAVATAEGIWITPAYAGVTLDSLVVSTGNGGTLFGPAEVYGDGTAFVRLREGTGTMPSEIDIAFDSDMGVFAVSLPVTTAAPGH